MEKTTQGTLDSIEKKNDKEVELNEELPLRASLVELEREVNSSYERWMKVTYEKQAQMDNVLKEIHKSFGEWLKFAVGSPSERRIKELYDFCVYLPTEAKELLNSELQFLEGIVKIVKRTLKYREETESRFERNLSLIKVLEKRNKELEEENKYFERLLVGRETQPMVEID